MNDVERFRRVSDLFERVRELPDVRRNALLKSTAANDPLVATEVERLLRHHDRGRDVLDEPIVSQTAVARAAASIVDRTTSAPEQIGRYRVLRRLGHGGMGIVYLAEQENPRRLVALKIIRPEFLSEQLIRRFELEADVLGRLRHIGIAQIYEAGVHEDENGKRPFLAMEYVDGPRLDHYIACQQPSVKDRVRLVLAIAEAVHHAHQKGVIHRDLKPSNILIRSDATSAEDQPPVGSTNVASALCPIPKILDFGIARATESDLQPTTWLTEEGQLVGTLPYMSPEQVSGSLDEVDTRCDVYALGVILYEALTERLPYNLKGLSIVVAARTISECEPEQLSKVHSDFRGDLNTIALKALEKQPELRYASAGEMALDLRRYLEDRPIHARPATTVYQLQKFAKRNKGLVAGILASLVILIGGIAATSWQAVRATREKLAAQEEAQFSQSANRFYRRILGSVDATALGKDATLRDAIHYAADLLEQETGLSPRVQAELRNALSSALLNLGDIGAAHNKLVPSTNVDTNSPEWQAAELRATRSLVLLKQGNLDEAERLVRLNLKYFRSQGMNMHSATALTRLAEIGNSTSRFEEAEAMARAAVEQFTKARTRNDNAWDVTRECEAINRLSSSLRYQGKYDEAQSWLEDGLQLALDHTGEDSSLVGAMKNSLGVLLTTLGRDEEAVPLFRDVLRIQTRLMGEQHPELASIQLNLGSGLRVLGKLDDAEEHLADALDILNHHYGSDHPLVLTTMSMIGNLRVDQARHDEAFDIFQDVLQRKTRVLGRRHLRTTISIIHLARAYQQRQEYDQADQLFQEALDIRREELGVDHPKTVSALREMTESRRQQEGQGST